MPWRDSAPMDLKTQFIADYLRQTLSVAELCYHYNINRKTGYKWIDRYLEAGAACSLELAGLQPKASGVAIVLKATNLTHRNYPGG